MHPDILILRTCIRSDSLSMRLDNHNTLTCQSVDTNYSPRDPLISPVTWNPIWTRPYSTLRLNLHLRLHSGHLRCHRDHRKHCPSASRALPSQHQGYDASAIVGIRSSMLSAVSNWIRLTCFFDLIRLNCLFFWIRFDSCLTYLILIRVTQFESHSSHTLWSPTLANVSLKYSNTEIVQYSTILII